MIQFCNISKQIAGVQVLDKLDFTAKNNQITGLLGPNGAGKTTCLRTLFGLLKPEQGKIIIDGLSVEINSRQVRQGLGLFPDPFGLYERLTPREYIHYFARLNGCSDDKARKATATIIARLQLSDIADRRCKGFSQGQQMKTALAQALVHNPKNIILDEPTRGLDVMSVRLLRQLLVELRKQGHCIIFASHVMQEIAALCDRVIIITKGRVVACGSPAQLCQQTGKSQLEEAFIELIGSDEGIAA